MTYLDGAGEDELAANSGKMMRMGLITALAITIHNFPEGMATFVSALQGEELALPITMATVSYTHLHYTGFGPGLQMLSDHRKGWFPGKSCILL